MDLGDNQTPYGTYYNIASLVGDKLFGIDLPEFDDIPVLGDTLGKVKSVFSSGEGHPHSTSVITAKQFNNPVTESFRLEFPEISYKGNRDFKDFFDPKQKAIDDAIEITRNSLDQLGAVGSELREIFDAKVDEVREAAATGSQEKRHAAQQGYVNAVGTVWDDINNLFDQNEANGLSPDTRQEFYRQAQQASFEAISKDMFGVLGQEIGNTFRQTGRGTGLKPITDDNAFANVVIGGERLAEFKNEFFPDFQIAPTEQQQQGLIAAFQAFGHDVSATGEGKGGNKRVTREAFKKTLSPDLLAVYNEFRPTIGNDGNLSFDIDKELLRTRMFGDPESFFPPAQTVGDLQTPVTDITSFLSSFNPPEPDPEPDVPDGGTDDTPAQDTDDPNTIPGTDLPGTTIPDGGTGDDLPSEEDDGIDLDIPIPPIGDNGGESGGGSPGIPQFDLSIPLGAPVAGGGRANPVQLIPNRAVPVSNTSRGLVQPEVHKFTPQGFPVVSRGILQGRVN